MCVHVCVACTAFLYAHNTFHFSLGIAKCFCRSSCFDFLVMDQVMLGLLLRMMCGAILAGRWVTEQWKVHTNGEWSFICLYECLSVS